MYPNLTPTLVVMLGAALAVAAFVAVRRPFLRRLATRQVSRRRTEAMLVIGGSILGTSVIVASLVVGDTLNFSVKQEAYTHLGPIDEIVGSASLSTGAQAARMLAPLRGDRQVDGVMTILTDQAAAVAGTGGARRAVPRATVVGADLDQAAVFGAAGGPSGLAGPAPGAGSAVINSDLAGALGAKPGSSVTLYLYGKPVLLRVDRVVRARGLAGFGNSSSDGAAFISRAALLSAARQAPGAKPAMLTLVSNAGGVESGDQLTAQVKARVTQLLGPLAGRGATVQTVKHDVLKTARQAGDSMGSLFLFIGSFCIIVGIVLLMNIFVMLAEERKPEMGMLRAIGMKRSRLVRSYTIEGTFYALVASLLGIAVGLAVGRLAVVVAARLFASTPGTALQLTFHVTWVSLVNAVAMGFLIAFVTVVAMSIRISRFNIIAAIRDLPGGGKRSQRPLMLAACGAGSVAAAALSFPVVANGRSTGVYLLPAAAVLLALPVLVRVAPARAVYSGASTAVLAWSCLANTVRPKLLATNSTAAYIVMGCLLTVSAVVLVGQNQDLLLRPARWFTERPTPAGLTARLAVTYPLARRFRTGAILMMYSMIVFTLVLLSVLSTMINSTVDQGIAFATSGYALRVDFNPAGPVPAVISGGQAAPAGRQIASVAPLVTAPAQVRDLGPHRVGPVGVSVVGLPQSVTSRGGFALSSRLARLGDTDQAVWDAVSASPQYVVLDQYVGAMGGMNHPMYTAGDRLVLVDMGTGRTQTKTIAGIMKTSAAFTGIGGTDAFPVLMSTAAARSEFGSQARLSSALLRPAAGVQEAVLAARLQAQNLASGMVVTRIEQQVRKTYATNMGFFQLMQGFLVLGLLIAIAGLGVVMVRAVRERRRTVGVLRALGFQARWVESAFLAESTLVAAEGIALGAGLSIFVSYLLFRNNPGFSGYTVGFTVPWLSVAVIVVASLIASIAATYLPARAAARILPAVALRIAD